MKMKNQIQERRSTLKTSAIDAESRTVRAALSSEEPVARPFGLEILEHNADAIDMSRGGDNGLPLLINHDDGSLPIGRVRGLSLEKDGVLRGDLHFSEGTQASRDAWELARDGTLSDVSVRYRINDYDVRGEDEYHVTNWSLLEASVVSVPADASVGIGRQLGLEGIDMPEESKAPAAVPPKTTPTASRAAGRDEGARAERERITAINAVSSQFRGNASAQDLATQAIEDGTSVDDYRASLLDALVPVPATPSAAPITAQTRASTGIVPGRTAGQKMSEGLREAFHVKAGNIVGEEAQRIAGSNEFSGLSVIEAARMVLDARGVSTRGMSPTDIAGMTLGQSALRYIDPGTANQDTTDLPAILEDVINKAIFNGFAEAPVTWSTWCGTDSATDFKAGTRPGLSQFTSLEVVAENGAITDGIVTDKKEGFQVETYAKKYSITRQALVNDDLGALASIGGRMGQAAGRTVDESVYAFIETNGNMTEDGNPLFDLTTRTGTDINQIVDTTGPTTANIGLARENMGLRTDQNGVVLGIVPQYMVVPIQLEQQMLEISTFNADPTRVRRDNVYRTMWEPVSSPRLTDANDWYMFGQRGDAINVVFLSGAQTPMLSRDEGWSTLAAHWRVVLDFTVMAIDYRAAVKFANATP